MKRAVFLPAGRLTDLDRNQGLHGFVFDLNCRCRSAVPGCFLNELHPRGQPEFGVDVGEMGLHGPR